MLNKRYSRVSLTWITTDLDYVALCCRRNWNHHSTQQSTTDLSVAATAAVATTTTTFSFCLTGLLSHSYSTFGLSPEVNFGNFAAGLFTGWTLFLSPNQQCITLDMFYHNVNFTSSVISTEVISTLSNNQTVKHSNYNYYCHYCWFLSKQPSFPELLQIRLVAQ